MKVKFACSFSALALLAACGGSSDGSAANPTVSAPTVLKVFSDGAGIARVEATENGTTLSANVMSADVQAYSPDMLSAVDLSNVSFSSSNQYGSFYDGIITVNGLPAYLLIYQDDMGKVLLGYGETAYGNAAIAAGEKVSGIPTGTYVYNGTNVIGFRDGSYFEDGTFAMNVNFSTGTASLSGSTPNSTIGGTGISVNTSNGTFSGSNLTLSGNGLTSTASIYGNFHGAGATGVTGLYADNGSNPVIAGAIAGTR